MKKKQKILLTGIFSAAALLLPIGCMKDKSNPAKTDNPDLMTQLESIKVDNTANNNAAAKAIDYKAVSHADLVGYIDAVLHGATGTDPLNESSIASFCELLAQALESAFGTATITFSGDDIGNINNTYDNAGITHNAICQMVLTQKNSWCSPGGIINWVALRTVSDGACRIYCNKPGYSIDPGRFNYFSTNFLSANPNSSQQCETILANAVVLNELTSTDHNVMSLYLSQIATYTNISDICNYSIAYENTIVASTDPGLHKEFLLSCFSIVRHSSCLWGNMVITP